MRSLALLAIALLATACASFPPSTSNFRSEAVGTLEFQVDHPLAETYDIVARNTIRCHERDSGYLAPAGASFFVNVSSTTRVNGAISSEEGHATINVHFKNNVANGFMQVIDLETSSGGGTAITVYRLNDTHKWQTATESVRTWFDGDSSCYEMW
ncbi:hypothetical protein [Wenzhouxiangella sp. EGI_FJ10409]|uniref:hypothetical protein n=1 Tax=Wenzhouxiangella sp. EGI_FJ10409 TaxID=3243767 RepID=UPI0035DBD83A